jgi:hypothetical protein
LRILKELAKSAKTRRGGGATAAVLEGEAATSPNALQPIRLRYFVVFGRATAHNLLRWDAEIRIAGPNRWSDLRMNDPTRMPDVITDDLPREIIDLARHIAALPSDMQSDLEMAYNRVVDSVRRRRRILSLVQEALSQLRLDIKYLMFDLEVTRRERDELREQMGEF